MNSAVTPLIGNFAAAIRRMIPGPASNRKTRDPTSTAAAGPEASGSGLGMPVPSMTTTVLSALSVVGVVAIEGDVDPPGFAGETSETNSVATTPRRIILVSNRY